jgi:hypothetical protein
MQKSKIYRLEEQRIQSEIRLCYCDCEKWQASEKAKIIGEFELTPHADWTTTSPMPQRYLHFGGDESIRALQKAQGIISDEEASTSGGDNRLGEFTALRPSLICSNCREPNEPEAKFCSNPKCGMPLKFLVDSETIGEAEKIKQDFELLKRQQQRMQKTMSSMLKVLAGQSDTVEIYAPEDHAETNRIFEKFAKTG